MKDRFVRFCLLAIVLLLAGIFARMSFEPTPVRAAAPYQYRVLRPSERVDVLENTMNHAGQDGWRVVSVSPLAVVFEKQ